MLIGDGCIQKNNNSRVNPNHLDSYWFSFHHSTKQEDYALWKKEQIDSFFRKKGIERKYSWKSNIPNYNKKNGKTYYYCQYRLYWSKYFRIFHKWVYREDKTKRAKFLLNHIETHKHLSIWFMDDGSEEWNNNKHKDGSIYKTNPRLMLHICNFSIEEAKEMVEWFKVKYNVEPRVIKTTKGQPRLRFTANDSRKIFPLISVFVKQTNTGKNKFKLCLERY